MAYKEIALHDIISVDAREITKFDPIPGRDGFFTRKLVLLNDDGEEIVLNLFAKAEAYLKVEA